MPFQLLKDLSDRINSKIERGYVMKKHYAILWIMFAAFIFIRCTMKIPYWLVLSVMAAVLSVILLKESKLPSKRYIALSIILSVISAVAYLGYQRNPWILIYGLRAGIPTLITALAVFSVMERTGGYSFIYNKCKHPVLWFFVSSVGVGTVLAVINLMLPGEKGEAGFSLWKLLLALNPGIYEEMSLRAIYMAYCVKFLRKENESRMSFFAIFTMYFMMFVPHAAVHGFGFYETITVGVLFGLPFAVMQRRTGIASAMIAHWLVDAVRFIVNGI